MDEKTFQRLLAMSRTFQRVDHDRSEFWSGVQRGARRAYHGENFGTPEEHDLWLSLAVESIDHVRRDRGRGYRLGFHYDKLDPTDPRTLRKHLCLSIEDIAEIAAVSPRTVEGWEQGRPISEPAIQLIRKYLMI